MWKNISNIFLLQLFINTDLTYETALFVGYLTEVVIVKVVCIDNFKKSPKIL